MIIGVPRERTPHESRVGLTPSAAGALVRAGHLVLVQAGAGEPARFGDDAYRAVGASIVYSAEEVLGRADLLLKVKSLSPGEVALLHYGQTVLGFHHLAAVERSLLDAILKSGATLIGGEIIEDERGELPVLRAMSEIAGQLAVHVGAHYLETHAGGRGILLGGAPGIPPAHVVVLGAGVVGAWAARVAAGNMAQVTILDKRTDALRRAGELLGRGVITELAHEQSIARAVTFADVLIGAVLIRGERTARAVSRAMVETMKPGSVIVDVSIDQGGCVETSRPTTLDDPVFVEKGVTHYCVPNMASAVARTASLALTGALLPCVRAIAGSGIESALADDRGLAAGTYVYRGHLVSQAVARSFGVGCEPLHALLGTAPDPARVALRGAAMSRLSSWTDTYRSRVVSAERALASVRSGERVYIHPGAAEPEGLVRALIDRAPELTGVEVIHLLTLGEAGYVKPGMESSFRHTAMFVGANVREAVRDGRADYMPVSLSEIPALFTSGLLPIDVCLIHVSPPDEHGFCSFGVGVDCTKTAADVARTVIAEVNTQMPRTLGDSFIHVSKLDRIVESERKILELPHRPAEEVHRGIARHVAGLVEDGSTLQLGIGGIPDAVLKGLTDRRDLGVHTEMFSDGVMELIEAGVITNERKTLHRGKIIAGFLIGSTKLYEFVDNNAMVELHPNDYTNDPFVIAANDKMVAINSALQVDLTGQVCADSMGTSIYSGVGGQADFMRGAARSKGGKPIIALPSTAKNGAVTRIVPTLDPGAGVVTTRADVHYVVTEYGVASLHGRSLRQRAEALIAIAHPDFRERLLEHAIKHRYLDRSAGSPAIAAT